MNNCILIKAKDDKDIIQISNIIAPEHLEINVNNYVTQFFTYA